MPWFSTQVALTEQREARAHNRRCDGHILTYCRALQYLHDAYIGEVQGCNVAFPLTRASAKGTMANMPAACSLYATERSVAATGCTVDALDTPAERQRPGC